MKRKFNNRIFSVPHFYLISLIFLGSFPALSENSYNDLSNSYWAACYIDFLADKKIVSGYPDGSFRPNQKVSRAEFAAMLYAVLKENYSELLESSSISSVQSFKDVPASHWASEAIKQVSAHGFINGYPNNIFAPNKPISNAEMYTVVTKIDKKNILSLPEAEAILSRFDDENKVPSWALLSVAQAVKLGLLPSEIQPDSIQPNQFASRAIVASVLAKLFDDKFKDSSSEKTTDEYLSFEGFLLAEPKNQQQKDFVWSLKAADGKKYLLQNSASFSDQTWFKNLQPVSLQAELEEENNSLKIVKMKPLESINISVIGTLSPGYGRDKWLIKSDDLTYYILNPEKFLDYSWFSLGAKVQAAGDLRADIERAEGKAFFVKEMQSLVEGKTINEEIAVSGALKKTADGAEWMIENENTGKKYILLGVNSLEKADWFTEGIEVDAQGVLRPDIRTIYSGAVVMSLKSLLPKPDSIAGEQEVNIYYPNFANQSNDYFMLGEPIVKSIKGPNIPSKAIEILLDGPSGEEQLNGYYQRDDIRQFKLETIEINERIAHISLISPGNNLKGVEYLEEQLKRTLAQFPGIEEIKLKILNSDKQIIFSN